MEKICEFCLALRPLVFCKADSAFLCLSCDSRVHSANALSSKHSRALLCESCRDTVAFALCLDHRMLLCRACDAKLHGQKRGDSKAIATPKHQRRMVGAFNGCPSAKQFAALWGFDAGDLDSGAFDRLRGPSVSSSCVSMDPEGKVGPVGGSVSGSESNAELGSAASNSSQLGGGSCFPEMQTQAKDVRENQTCLIMQQILDLKRLQLSEGSNQMPSSSLIRERVNSKSSFSAMYNKKDDNPSVKLDGSLDDSCQGVKILSNEFVQLEGQHFNSPLAQMDYLSAPSTAEISLGKEPFWQSESTLESSSQFWSQNLEELGTCQEQLDCFDDDFKIPEVDMTFRNFEELLGSDEDLSRALSDDTDTALWSADEDTLSGDKSENSHTRLSQMNEGVSAASLLHMDKSAEKEKTLIDNPPAHNNTHGTSKSIYNSRLNTVRPSYSASYSFSHLSTESSGGGGSSRDDLDSGNLPNQWEDQELKGQDHSLAGSSNSSKCKDRKKAKMNQRTSHLAPRQAKKVDTNKRVKSRFAKIEASEPNGHVNVT